MVQVSDALALATPVEALVLNRSAGGLCLSINQEVAVGSRLSVRVATAPPSIPWVQVEVKYCNPFVKRWKVGCQFVPPPAVEVLCLFG